MTRGEIWWADFGIPFGSEPGYKRPVLLVQDNFFNRSKINTVVILPLSTNLLLADAPGNILLKKEHSKLSKDSVVVASLITSIDRRRLIEKNSKIGSHLLADIEDGLRIVLGFKKSL